MNHTRFEVTPMFENTSTEWFETGVNGSYFYEYDTLSSTTEAVAALGIFPIGFLGNCLTIFTLTRPRNRNSTTAFFLTILAVSDNIILLSGSFYFWLTRTLGVYDSTEVECRLAFFLSITSIQISSWTLATISIERAFCVALPLKAKTIFTKRTAIFISGLVTVFFCSLNIGFVIFQTKESDENICYFEDPFIPFYTNIFPVLDFLFTFLLPCIILIVTSLITIIMLQKKMKGKNAFSVVSTVAVTMLLVNLVFVITMLPFCVYQIINTDNSEEADMYSILLQVAELNPVFNFPLYCLANKRFRNEVKSLLLKCQSEKSSEGVFGGKASSIQ